MKLGRMVRCYAERKLTNPGLVLVPILVEGKVRHLIRCFCRFRAERFVGRLHRLGVNASIGGRWVTDEIGCRFVDTTHPAVR